MPNTQHWASAKPWSLALSDTAEMSLALSDTAEMSLALSDTAEMSLALSDTAEMSLALSDSAEMNRHVLDARTVEEANLYLRVHFLSKIDSRIPEMFEVLATKKSAANIDEYFIVRFRIAQPANTAKPLGTGLSRILDPVDVVEFAERIARLFFDIPTPNPLAPRQLDYASTALTDAAHFFDSTASNELLAWRNQRNAQQTAYAQACAEKMSKFWLNHRALELRRRAEHYRQWAAQPPGTAPPWNQTGLPPARVFAMRWLDGLKLANGHTKAAAQYSTVFAIGDESCLSAEGIDSGVIASGFDFIYGNGWQAGNVDGSSYQILEGPQFMLPTADVALAAAANIASRPDQVRFLHVSAPRAIVKLDTEYFKTLVRSCKF